MKKFLIASLTAATLFCGNISADAASYFMQGDAKGSSTPYGENFSVGKYVQSDDAKIYYEVYGKGEPILILHGGGVGTPYELGKILDELKKNYKIIVMSTRGHGKSEIGHSEITWQQKVSDAVKVINEVTSEPVKIFSFSDGAYTAYKIAEICPEKVERIVAVGAGTLHAGFFPAEMNFGDLEKFDEKFIAEQKKIRPEPERWQEFMSDYMKFWNKQEFDKNVFEKINCPVLLIVGDEDDHAPVVTVLAAHQMIKNSRLAVIPKAWHSAFNDNYKTFASAFYPFINAKLDDLQPSKKVDYNNHAIF